MLTKQEGQIERTPQTKAALIVGIMLVLLGIVVMLIAGTM